MGLIFWLILCYELRHVVLEIDSVTINLRLTSVIHSALGSLHSSPFGKPYAWKLGLKCLHGLPTGLYL